VFDKGVLHGMKIPARGQSLDGGDFVALMRRRQAQTGINPAAVHQHSASAALAVIATFFCPGHVEVFTQQIEQSYAWI